jgi:hypothetical protein
MTDLHIIIIDENNDILRKFEIYQDGSDSETVEEIVKMLGEKYESLSELTP